MLYLEVLHKTPPGAPQPPERNATVAIHTKHTVTKKQNTKNIKILHLCASWHQTDDRNQQSWLQETIN